MAITVTASGGNSTLTISYSASTDKLTDVLSSAARNIHGRKDSGVDFNSLTNAQKLAILDDFLKKFILQLAKEQYVTSYLLDAQNTVNADAQTRFNLV